MEPGSTNEVERTWLKWEELPTDVKDFAGNKFGDVFKQSARFVINGSGLVEFKLSSVNLGNLSITDSISGEIALDDKRIVINHNTEQIAGVLDDGEGQSGILALAEAQRWGIVYHEGGRNSSLFIVAKDWQISITIDANGILDLPPSKLSQLHDHMNSNLGLQNQMKLDLEATCRSISNPMTSIDAEGSYSSTPSLSTGLPVINIPIVLSPIN